MSEKSASQSGEHPAVRRMERVLQRVDESTTKVQDGLHDELDRMLAEYVKNSTRPPPPYLPSSPSPKPPGG